MKLRNETETYTSLNQASSDFELMAVPSLSPKFFRVKIALAGTINKIKLQC